GHLLFVWLRNGRDVFRRPFDLPPVEPDTAGGAGAVKFAGTPAFVTADVKDVALNVTVTLAAGKDASKVEFKNNQGADVKGLAGTVYQLVDKAEKTDIKATDVPNGQTVPVAFTAVDVASPCRVVVAFKIGTDSFAAALDVSP